MVNFDFKGKSMNLEQETRYILNKYNAHANKGYGQNFLIDQNVVDVILEKAEVNKDDLEIRIDIDKNARRLTISDNGIGMNKDDLINHLGTIAKSGTADFIKNINENGSNVDLIGQFGVGFYSAFMVASKVEITTKKAGENQAWSWESDGINGFEIKETQKQ